MSCADNLRRFRTNLLPETAETGLKGGRENGCDFNPLLLLLDRLGSSSNFVPNLRKNDIIDASYQHTTSLVARVSLVQPIVTNSIIWLDYQTEHQFSLSIDIEVMLFFPFLLCFFENYQSDTDQIYT